jgi:putative transposase
MNKKGRYTVRKSSIEGAFAPVLSIGGFEDELTSLLREGAQRMLKAAVEAEVAEYIHVNREHMDREGKRLVVRNGHHPERNIQTGLGLIPIKKPKINDKRIDEQGERMRFESQILPAYLKRTQSVEELVPWLYLRGISTGDFPQALEALLGKNAGGLSATNIVRMKKHWEEEFTVWSKRDLSKERFVYFWADGVYPRLRLEEASGQCFLVIMGATQDGRKQLVAIGEGMRESEIAWRGVLLDLKRRGLTHGAELGVGDGALGFWAALSKEYPNTKHQRCWVHKTRNVLDKLPKSSQGKAKGMLHDIYRADTRSLAERAVDEFSESFIAKHPRAVECLTKDRDELLAFYDFPADHWIHIRTTNPIESLFSTIRLRTKRTKGHGSVKAASAMAFKLAQCAEKKWKKLRGSQLLADVISMKCKFEDGLKVELAA